MLEVVPSSEPASLWAALVLMPTGTEDVAVVFCRPHAQGLRFHPLAIPRKHGTSPTEQVLGISADIAESECAAELRVHRTTSPSAD